MGLVAAEKCGSERLSKDAENVGGEQEAAAIERETPHAKQNECSWVLKGFFRFYIRIPDPGSWILSVVSLVENTRGGSCEW